MKPESLMSFNSHPLSEKEFHHIYSKVPRLTVEIVVRSHRKVLLVKRKIQPCRGLWHLPGGTVQFGERLTEAVTRIAERELGISASAITPLGYIEYPSHYKKGLDCPVGIAFEVLKYSGQLEVNDEAEKFGWFTDLPAEMHPEQSQFLNAIYPRCTVGGQQFHAGRVDSNTSFLPLWPVD